MIEIIFNCLSINHEESSSGNYFLLDDIVEVHHGEM